MGFIDETAVNVILPVMPADRGATLTSFNCLTESQEAMSWRKASLHGRLGGAERRPGLTPSQEAELSDAIDDAFLNAFLPVMYIPAALAKANGAIAL
jgi:hypothetical protein